MLVSAILLIGFCMLYANHKDMFDKVEQAYEKGRAINIDKETKAGQLAKTLYDNGCLDNADDALFVATWVTKKLRSNKTPNLGVLNKKEFAIPADTALAEGGPEIRERAKQALLDHGWSDEVEKMYEQLPKAQTVTFGDGKHLMEVAVLLPDSNANALHKAWGKIKEKMGCPPLGIPAPNVVVRLRGHSFNTSNDGFGNETLESTRDSVMGYAVTDADGVARFRVPTGYYSVLPVKKGFSFGSEKGTTKDILNEDAQWYFTDATPICISPLTPKKYAQAKQDLCLTVRTPAQYRDSIVICLMLFLGGWWAALLLLDRTDRARAARMRKEQHTSLPTDFLTCTMLMTLTAICLLAMFGIAHPLTDTDLGRNMAPGILMGVAAMTALSYVRLPEFYNGQYRGLAASLAFKLLSPDGKGYFKYFLMAVTLMLVLLVFGTGPQGSDAKVNLGFFQPSEITKYLIVVAIAAFFTQKADLIQEFSQKGRFKLQGRLLWSIAACMAAVVFLYVILSDMGPALVTVVTFILLYSVARKDTPQLFLGTATFILTLALARWVNPTATTTMAFALAWAVAWVAGGLALRHRVSESAIMMAFVISAFVFLGDLFASIGQEAIANRLINRKAMAWSGVWQNDVTGGDQVAQGIWGLATGGLGGQGLGHGNPNLIPAFNTDMILSSIGEILGWVTVVLVILCLGALLHRTLLLARRAAHPFTFFLLTGIAIATGMQFFVIVLGSLGLIPLTGVAVPFLSYGKASMIINLAAFGLVLSGSRDKGGDRQRKKIAEYDNVVASSAAIFIGLGIITLASMFNYQALFRNKYLVKPAFISNANGVPFAEYNPRIQRLERQLFAGNIYDRNGLLLATSNLDDVEQVHKKLVDAGLDGNELTALEKRRQLRYYPFGMHTVFAVGDLNEGFVRNESASYPTGYGAEYRHIVRLHGFKEMKLEKEGKTISVNSRHYKPSRFLPMMERKFNIQLHDYSDPKFVAMLKAGEHSMLVEKWNGKRTQRDLRLTIDARLQTMMQKNMEQEFSPLTKAGGNGARGKLRASVVIVNAGTGDLLCSANYPLPTPQDISSHQNYSNVERQRKPGTITPQDLGTTFATQPGSTAKVITQMAAFKKLGTKASSLTYKIRTNELIGHDKTGNFDMSMALVQSNNAFHIHLAHDQNLYELYATIDYLLGMRLHLGSNSIEKREAYIPYYFHADEKLCDSTDYKEEMGYLAQEAVPLYQRLFEQNQMVKGKAWTAAWQFGAAWGQHNIYATPLTMARAAAIVANDGLFVPTRFVLDEPKVEPKKVIDVESAQLLQGYMREEAKKHANLLPSMGGKTGTPVRNMPGRKGIVNDAWYICFIPQRNAAPLAIALRLERSVENSVMAVRYIKDIVLNTLREAGYGIGELIPNNQ